MLESAFAMLLHHAPTQYPARAARQWIPPSIPPEQLASGRQSCSPVDPAEYPARAARQWIPPSIPPEQLASGSRRVSRQSCSDPARAARQWIPPSITPGPEQLASRVSRQSSPPVDPAEYPAEYPSARVGRQWIGASIPLSIPWRWILPSIRPASSRSGLPVLASGSRQYPARAARQSGFAYCPARCTVGFTFHVGAFVF